LAEVKAADARQRFTLLARPDSLPELCDRLVERSRRREEAETDRIARVVSLVTHEGCQVNALVAYFGELRAAPCGHCSFCLSGEPQKLPEGVPPAAIEALVDERAFAALQSGHPDALGLPRQQARFLCGLSSPATVRAKLTRDALYGVVAGHRFAAVLDWCEGRAG
jgi:ATP-dependent DNA helicase RecQ